MGLLDTIISPSELRGLPETQLVELAGQIRAKIIEVTARNGGHIGPNLGVVELSIALHRVFESPADKIVFDVSHQGYVHKLLTGRGGAFFERLRQTDGPSGFLNRAESPHDIYGAGHAGTALSAALGLAVARDRLGGPEHVVSVIGDGSLTCGVTLEALNNIAIGTRRLIVVLNDNEWSIAKNVGAIANYLNNLITSPTYNKIDQDLKSFLERVPGGHSLIEFGRKWKKETKDFIVSSSLFESFGLRYIGPLDGHDLPALIRYLEFAKTTQQPVLLHLLTVKGRGYAIAEKHPERFHGASPFDPATGQAVARPAGTPSNWQDVFGEILTRYAEADATIVGLTAAMPAGTGLNKLKERCPKQFFDVGIAEEHAVIFAGGLAIRGLKPVVAIYSTFLQRAFDPVIHDICLQRLPVVFCLDRAGLSPNDGPTHHGLYDLAYLRLIPNAVIAQPRDEAELADLLWTGLHLGQPCFIRYPRGPALGLTIPAQPRILEVGCAEVLREGLDAQIWALGPWVQEALALVGPLAAATGLSWGVVDARWVKPLDRQLLLRQARATRFFATMEDGIASGGLGSAVLETLGDLGYATPVERIGWPDTFITHGSTVEDLRQAHGLDRPSLYERLCSRVESMRHTDYSVLTRPAAV